MIIIGLTGSIGMGKSATAAMFADEGCAVYDADAAVHALYAKGGGAVAPIVAIYPDVLVDSAIDRARLSAHVVGDAARMEQLEAIVHPLVRLEQTRFLQQARAAGAAFAVLDIPLLFEGEGHKYVHKTVMVSAPPHVQRARVLARPGMSAEKFEAILAKQIPDAEKRRRADFVIDTSHGFDHARAQVRAILDTLSKQA
jgi:dephospho-CoA kinase